MSKKREKYKRIATFLIITLGITFTSAFASSDDSIVQEVKQALKIYFVDDLPDSVYNQTTVQDIIKEVNKDDPYTKYYSPSKYIEFMNSINNDTAGLGAFIQMVPEGAKVMSLINNTPEKDAGLCVGDIILMADNQILVGLSQEMAIKYIKGVPGNIVTLKVKRGTDLISVNVLRKATPNDTISSQTLDKHIGYIKINSFAENSDSLFTQIITRDETLKLDSYIIDLRYNQGGFVIPACNIAGYFISNNVAFVSKGKLRGENKYFGKYHGFIINKPVIFLINQYTASAAEILSAAVKDFKKAYFIGTTTFGKGRIQWPYTLSNNDVLKLTIERFVSPMGNQIDKVGVKPDLAIGNDQDAMNMAEMLLDANSKLNDNRGYVKVNFNDKSVILKLTKAEDQTYWQTYKLLLNLAAKNGSVMFGTGRAWVAAPKKYLNDVAKMYYPTYKQANKYVNVNLNSAFNIQFDASIKVSSVNKDNIELIDIQTGKRVPVELETKSKVMVKVSPINNLLNNKTYYLVIHPSIIKADDSPLGYGKLTEIVTVKNG